MHRFTRLVHSMLKDNFTGLLQDKSQEDNFDPFGFGLSRTHELPISLMWLYENHPRENGDVILETIDLMFEGGRVGGGDWTQFFVKGVFPEDGNFKTSGFTHVLTWPRACGIQQCFIDATAVTPLFNRPLTLLT